MGWSRTLHAEEHGGGCSRRCGSFRARRGGRGSASSAVPDEIAGDGCCVEGGDDLELGDEFARLTGRGRRGAWLPLESPFSAEDWTPTRVTPSISFSPCTKPATASWLPAHPTSSRAGPGPSCAARRLPAPSGETWGLTVPVRLVSQTSLGRISASSCTPFPVEAAVGEAGHRGDALLVDALELPVGVEPGARAFDRCLFAFNWTISALRSPIWLSVTTSTVTPASAATIAPTTM